MDPKCLIISASSDIGYELAMDWARRGYQVSGTFRTMTEKVLELKSAGLDLAECDLADTQSIERAAGKLFKKYFSRVVLAAGTQEPIGLFGDTNFDDWAHSFEINFLGQLRFLHYLIQNNGTSDARVLLFAGGGTNSATQRYSAYTISKIASIKMVELLAAEYPQTAFTILGPGWVKTKIHNATLNEPDQSGPNYQITVERFNKNNFFSMEKVIECINWIFDEEVSLISGRNFSAVHDQWGSEALRRALRRDPSLYTLRRAGNDSKFS